MQNRTTAIIMSLGMLLEKVDTSGFIGKLLKKAKEENDKFIFVPELQKQAFILSESFNLGKLEPKEFESKLLLLLDIKKMESNEFWSEWNSIVAPGKMGEQIQLLQDMSDEHNALVYLSSDTNPVHLEKIAKEKSEEKIELDTKKQPMTLGQFPLYTSCQVGKNRQELIKHIVAVIQAKQFNKPDKMILILGNPENIKDKNHQAVAAKECDAIVTWCSQNNVSVQLHNDSLEKTFGKIFKPEKEETETETRKLAFG